jgi:hypothetical protein
MQGNFETNGAQIRAGIFQAFYSSSSMPSGIPATALEATVAILNQPLTCLGIKVSYYILFIQACYW